MADSTPGAPRRKLSEILNGGVGSLRTVWDATKAADEFKPLPAGTYVARIIGGELSTAKTGTPGYKLTFKALDDEYYGRQFWLDIWLTAAALPMAKRDLAKLGITSIEQLELPIPVGIRVKAKVTLRKDEDGSEYNRVKSFEVIGIDPEPTVDPDFPPAPSPAGKGGTQPKAPPTTTATSGPEPDESPDVTDAEIHPDAKAALDSGKTLFPPTGPKESVRHD